MLKRFLVMTAVMLLVIPQILQAGMLTKLDNIEKKLLKNTNELQKYFAQKTNLSKVKTVVNIASIDSSKIKQSEAQNFFNQAKIEITKGSYSNAHKLLLKSYIIFQELDLKKEAGFSLLNIAIIQNNLGLYNSALDYASSALSLFKEAEYYKGEASVYSTIGNIYTNLKDYNSASDSYKKEFEALRKTDKNENESYINLAKINSLIGNNDKAFRLLEQANAVVDSNDFITQAENLDNLGKILFDKKDYTKALSYFQKALALKQHSNNTYEIVYSELQISECYYNIADYSNSIKYAKTAIEKSKQIKFYLKLVKAYKILSDIYEKTNDYKSALDAYKNQSRYSDSLYNENTKESLQTIKTKIQFHEIESENKFLKKRSMIVDIKNDNNRFLQRFMIYIILAASLLLIILIYQLYLKRQKNRELAMLNEQIKSNEIKLRKINDTKDQFFSIISHDLRNPLASMISFVRILRRDYDSMSKDEREELIDEFSTMVNNTMALLENLLMWSRSQTGNMKLNFSTLSAKNIISNNAKFTSPNAKAKGISIIAQTDNEDILIHADENMINTVLRNLITNAIKFTKQNGTISTGYYIENNKCVIYVKDSGIGIEKDKIDEIFDLINRNVRTGTGGEKGSGLGLTLCKDFIEKNKGNIWVESEINVGSTFYFSLPLASTED